MFKFEATKTSTSSRRRSRGIDSRSLPHQNPPGGPSKFTVISPSILYSVSLASLPGTRAPCTIFGNDGPQSTYANYSDSQSGNIHLITYKWATLSAFKVNKLHPPSGHLRLLKGSIQEKWPSTDGYHTYSRCFKQMSHHEACSLDPRFVSLGSHHHL